MDEDVLMKVEQVAKILNVAPLTVYRLLERGKLRGAKVGRVWRIRPRDLEAFLDQSSAGQQDDQVGET